MIIIADSGSTKTTWSVFDQTGKREDFSSEGYNPYFLEESYIVSSVRASLGDVFFDGINRVYFYGAGCEGDRKEVVVNALKVLFNNAVVEVDSDMVAAYRSLLGNGSGLACILGTGTNSCLVSGGKLVHQVRSLGFLLGDEGSGAYLGRKLLALYARNMLPLEIMSSFYDEYNIEPGQVLNHFYNSKLQNRFAASFSIFLKRQIADPSIREIVGQGFIDFFKNIICQYPDYRKHHLNCVGSIAFVFKDILSEVANEFGMDMGIVSKSPIDNLCKYHADQVINLL